MYALGDDIPLLAIGPVAIADLDGREVLAEVARAADDEEALAVRGLDLGGREGAGRGVVTFLRLCGRAGVELNETGAQGHRTRKRTTQKKARHSRNKMHDERAAASSWVCVERASSVSDRGEDGS